MEPRSRRVLAFVVAAALVAVALAAGPAFADAGSKGDDESEIDALTASVGRPLDDNTLAAWVASLSASVGRPIDEARVDEYFASLTGSPAQATDGAIDEYLASLTDSVGRPIDRATFDGWVTSLEESTGRPIDPGLVAQYLASSAGTGLQPESSGERTTAQDPQGANVAPVAITSLVLMLGIVAAAIVRRQRRHDRMAPA